MSYVIDVVQIDMVIHNLSLNKQGVKKAFLNKARLFRRSKHNICKQNWLKKLNTL